MQFKAHTTLFVKIIGQNTILDFWRLLLIYPNNWVKCRAILDYWYQ